MGASGAQAMQRARPIRLLEPRPHPVASIATLLVVFLYSGMFMQILPVCVPAILAEWKLPQTVMATPIAAILIGSGLGTILGGAIADTFGRRITIGTSLLLLAVCIAAASLSATPLQLLTPMLVGGLTMGIMYVAAMALVTELVPDRKRPVVISFTVASLPVGLGVASMAAAFLVPVVGWSFFFQLTAVLALPIALAFLVMIPESPTFLIRKAGCEDQCQRVIARLGLEQVTASPVLEHTGKREPLLKRFATLVRANPRATIGIWGLFCATYIFGNAILNWMPVALTNMGFEIPFASGALTAWTIASMAGTPVAGWCMYRFGLRRSAGFSSILGALLGLALALIALRGLTSELAVLAVLPLGGMASAGVVTALYTMVAEAYPPEVRAMGVGTSDAIGRVGGTAGAFFGIYVIDGSGPAVFFLILAALMLLVGLYLLWLHPFARND